MQDEVDHLENLKNINSQYDAERIAAIKGNNAEEQKFRAETALKIIKNTGDTFDKIKQIRLKHYEEEREELKKQFEQTQAAYKKQFDDEAGLLKKQFESGTADGTLENETVQKSPVASETQKAISQQDFDDTQIQRAEKYYADLESAAERNKQDLAKIDEEKNATLKALQVKGLLDGINIQKAFLQDIETASENENTKRLISDGAAIVKLYENRKLTTKKREEEIQDIQRKYDEAELQRLKDKAAKEIPILNALFAAQIISLKQYQDAVEKLQAAIANAEKNVASNINYKKAKTLKDQLKDKAPQERQGIQGIGETIDEEEGVDPNSAGGKILSDSYAFADTAMNAYFDNEQRRIENSLKLQERILDAQERTALSHAQSSAEADTIDRQYQAKKLQAEKDAFNKQKKLQLQQAKVSLFEQIVNAWAASFELGPIAAPFYAAVMTALAFGRYTLSASAINAQQFARGGRIDHPGNGRIRVDSNIPTQPNGDNVLATVRRGEVILNEQQQARAGGATFFKRLGVPGFADGGFAGSSLSSLNPHPFAPDFQIRHTYYANQSSDNTIADKLDLMRDDMNAHRAATDSRIDRIEVQQVTASVVNATKKLVRQANIGKL